MRRVIVGQDEVVEQLLLTMLVGGHCLITGLPGTAKTLLVRTLADALGLIFKRIQFTPDLMPTDMTGTDIIEEDPTTGRRRWTFVPGPIFANILLADEINRTPPKTQAALLEAMQERSVTVRGNTRTIEPPFFVLATQNPIELEGTYPLPEAQLDRFLFNILLDYLSAEDERLVVERNTNADGAADGGRLHGPGRDPEIPVARAAGAGVRGHAAQRRGPGARHAPGRARRSGCREAVRAFRRQRARHAVPHVAAKARALMAGRYHVTKDDLTALALPVLRHRVLTNYQAESDGMTRGQGAHRDGRRQLRRSACVSANPSARLLTPEVLAGLANLELVARTAVEGISRRTAPLAAFRLQPGVRGVPRVQRRRRSALRRLERVRAHGAHVHPPLPR